MFKITPIQTKARQKDICELFGTEFRAEAFAYILFDHDTGDVMGMSQFEVLGSGYYQWPKATLTLAKEVPADVNSFTVDVERTCSDFDILTEFLAQGVSYRSDELLLGIC